LKRLSFLVAVILLLCITSCKEIDTSSKNNIPHSVSYDIKDNKVSFNLGKESDVWFIFTNTTGKAVTNPINLTKAVLNQQYNENEVLQKEFKEDRYSITDEFLPTKTLQTGSTYFYYRGENNKWKYSPATCLYSGELIETRNGKRRVSVFADNNSINDDCISAEKAQELGKKFAETLLIEGENNDLYDILTYWFGEEWRSEGLPGYIDSTDEITIYITDIDDDGVLKAGQVYTFGYFSPADLMTIPLSNQRLMITIDSYVCKSNPKSALSTIAHEFQHAIHYNYSSSITTEEESINEMFSSVAEQLVSRFLGVPGPEYVDPEKGVTQEPSKEYTVNSVNGRIPVLLDSFNDSLEKWDGEQKDYSTVFSFGSYLLRNYAVKDNKSLFRSYLESGVFTYNSLFSIINKMFGNNYSKTDYFRDWGVANLLSDITDTAVPYRMNTGKNMDIQNQKVASINLFAYFRKSDYNKAKANIEEFSQTYINYTPGIHSTTEESFNNSTNNYYFAGEMSAGEHSIELDNPLNGLILTVITK